MKQQQSSMTSSLYTLVNSVSRTAQLTAVTHIKMPKAFSKAKSVTGSEKNLMWKHCFLFLYINQNMQHKEWAMSDTELCKNSIIC